MVVPGTCSGAVGPEALSDLRRYLGVHWKHPAATVPKVGLR